MGLFDGQGLGGPAPTNVADMYRGVGRTIGKGLIDPAMESRGFKSEENQVIEIMKGVDLTDAKSVSDTFNRIMEINPQAAAEFQKQVMPMLESNQAAKAAEATRNDPGTFRKSLETAALILGCDLQSDAKCRTEAYDLVKDYKRQNVWEGGSAEALVDDMVLVQGEAGKTVEEISRFDQLLGILPQIYTGWAGEGWLAANKVGALFGIPAATQAAGQMEVFAAGGMELALKYIEQTKGAVSDKEFAAFRASAPALSRTKAGNELMLKTAKGFAVWRQKKAVEQNRWIKEQRDNGRVPMLEDWSAHLLKWASYPQNKPFLPTQVEIDAAANAADSTEVDEQLSISIDELSEMSDEELIQSLQ